MTEIRLVNTAAGQLAVDAKLGFKKPIKAVIPQGGFFDAGDVATMDELNQNPEIRALVDAGKIRIDLVAEANDLVSEDGVPSDLGIGMTHTVITSLVDLGTTNADDVTVVASMPWPAQLVSALLVVETGVATETITLRDTAGGAGNALSAALDGGTDDTRDPDVTTAPIPALSRGDLITARRTHDGIIGQLVVELMRTA